MNDKRKILLVEDNEHLNKINSKALRLAGYTVLTARTLAAAREHLKTTEPDAIILDILMPDGNGVDFCRSIREHTSAPILFLTSVTGTLQALEGIRAGGDDYINKPFHIELLLARVEAFWRRDAIRQRMKPAENLVRGPLTLSIVSNSAYVNGEDLLLTVKEFALLLLLVQNEGKVLTKDLIFQKIWEQPLNQDNQALYTVVSRLKRKLEPYSQVVHLTAVRQEGYRLIIDG